MDTLTKMTSTYWTNKWADMVGLDRKDVNEALKMITDITMNTDYDEDIIKAIVISSYSLNPPETIFDKFERGQKIKNAGKLVKFCRY